MILLTDLWHRILPPLHHNNTRICIRKMCLERFICPSAIGELPMPPSRMPIYRQSIDMFINNVTPQPRQTRLTVALTCWWIYSRLIFPPKCGWPFRKVFLIFYRPTIAGLPGFAQDNCSIIVKQVTCISDGFPTLLNC